MKKVSALVVLVASALTLFAVTRSQAQTLPLLAVGTLSPSTGDLSGLPGPLENGVAGNLLGGLGSALTYASGNTFLALPDRGPNAVVYPAPPATANKIDNTVSYVNRFHTITMNLVRNTSGSGLPFILTPTLTKTTLLYSKTALSYGPGGAAAGNNYLGNPIPPGAPSIDTLSKFYFTGRSDNFDPAQNSGYPNDARYDTEGLRISNDGRHVYISDEYGPYVYEFDRSTGQRTRSFQLPERLFVPVPSAMGKSEINTGKTPIAADTFGRVANKGMEGLALTPDGRTLVGIVQNALIQDAGSAPNLLRVVVMDIECGCTTHQYGYVLTHGSGVSEMVAINDHQFFVDERDGNGREGSGDDIGPSNAAVVKQLFMIDLDHATDISFLDNDVVGTPNYASDLAKAMQDALPKKPLFVDVVASLTAPSLGPNAFDPTLIPAKIEGVSFGPDIREEDCTPEVWERFWRDHRRHDDYRDRDKVIHTLWIANDNDFLPMVFDSTGKIQEANPNQFFVFGFSDEDIPGFVPQQFERESRW